MPAFSNYPVHQYAAQSKEQHTGSHERCCDEEIVAFAHLEPRCFREWDVGGQKY